MRTISLTALVGAHWWVNPDALKADKKDITPGRP
jgi:hypothetical protein